MCAWDLEEPDSRHPQEKVGEASTSLRRPSYTTEYLADVATTAAPIVGVATTPRSKTCFGLKVRCAAGGFIPTFLGTTESAVSSDAKLAYHVLPSLY